MIKDVATIGKDVTIKQAGTLMSNRNIGSLIVVEKEKPVGIITERDFLKKIVALGTDPMGYKVRDLMTSPLISISTETTILEANDILQKSGIRRLPVVEKGKLKGIVTETDIMKALDSMVLDIIPSAEKQAKVTKEKYKLELGFTYLVEEERPERSLDMFVDSVLHDRQGLAITRIHPQKIKEKYGLRKTPIVWLTNIPAEIECIYPTDLEQLSLVITKYITKAKKAVIYLEGVEYLVNNNTFNRVLHMLQFVRDKISTSKASLIISITPLSFDQQDLKLLEREVDHVETVEV